MVSFSPVEEPSTEIPTSPSEEEEIVLFDNEILPLLIAADFLVTKIPADFFSTISIPLVPVPVFVTLDRSPIIPIELSSFIFTKPLLVTSDCVLAWELSFFA